MGSWALLLIFFCQWFPLGAPLSCPWAGPGSVLGILAMVLAVSMIAPIGGLNPSRHLLALGGSFRFCARFAYSTQFGLACVRRDPQSRRTNLSQSASHAASIQVCYQVYEDGCSARALPGPY